MHVEFLKGKISSLVFNYVIHIITEILVSYRGKKWTSRKVPTCLTALNSIIITGTTVIMRLSMPQSNSIVLKVFFVHAGLISIALRKDKDLSFLTVLTIWSDKLSFLKIVYHYYVSKETD